MSERDIEEGLLSNESFIEPRPELTFVVRPHLTENDHRRVRVVDEPGFVEAIQGRIGLARNLRTGRVFPILLPSENPLGLQIETGRVRGREGLDPADEKRDIEGARVFVRARPDIVTRVAALEEILERSETDDRFKLSPFNLARAKANLAFWTTVKGVNSAGIDLNLLELDPHEGAVDFKETPGLNPKSPPTFYDKVVDSVAGIWPTSSVMHAATGSPLPTDATSTDFKEASEDTFVYELPNARQRAVRYGIGALKVVGVTAGAVYLASELSACSPVPIDAITGKPLVTEDIEIIELPQSLTEEIAGDEAKAWKNFTHRGINVELTSKVDFFPPGGEIMRFNRLVVDELDTSEEWAVGTADNNLGGQWGILAKLDKNTGEATTYGIDFDTKEEIEDRIVWDLVGLNEGNETADVGLKLISGSAQMPDGSVKKSLYIQVESEDGIEIFPLVPTIDTDTGFLDRLIGLTVQGGAEAAENPTEAAAATQTGEAKASEVNPEESTEANNQESMKVSISDQVDITDEVSQLRQALEEERITIKVPVAHLATKSKINNIVIDNQIVDEESIVLVKDAENGSILAPAYGWGETEGQIIHFWELPKIEGLNQVIVIDTDEGNQFLEGLELLSEKVNKWHVAYEDPNTGEIAYEVFVFREGNPLILTPWSYDGAYAATRVWQGPHFKSIIWANPPEVDTTDEAVDEWVDRMFSEGKFYSNDPNFKINESDLRERLNLIKKMPLEMRAYILGYDRKIDFWGRKGSLSVGPEVKIDTGYLTVWNDYDLIAVLIHELTHQAGGYRSCTIDTNGEYQGWMLELMWYRIMGISQPEKSDEISIGRYQGSYSLPCPNPTPKP
ncbi:hypothetical protein A2715_01465 [Candidatus Woesebacteria bacterium RIFCSPHIGHO2_01_FULL_39_32]|uniref:Uncharacterized protein n=1 Tax=Candidatus Woesebacteria bacterium RIFCSPLOWO2_01_FULL_39_25 TaxID=1802521 RepID=A0A1F8BJJ0_9BACT|nr:MAG: hypothetical protein A2715_01465 [Candidatus Woesebacteria bacterium RIFCSPHIGHO2_01_FULL_39_32]OGM38419.1 MAG: hypothetical protein A3F01_00035 [Candidatus Woesebacteria bacterium RIFCSPHIGHO2_12_FULL_38_11]OGM64231.1 MAG: hypothetical protein A2893_06730 [Candidatus Woesebacteria bacterium RIFCSPLOWO2_01_FULL_39_25]